MPLQVDANITALVVELLNQKLADEYLAKGKTQNQMERDIDLGKSHGRLAQLFKGKGIGPKVLPKLAKFLGMTTEELRAKAAERATRASMPSGRIDPLDLAIAVAEDISKDGYVFDRNLIAAVRASRVDSDPLAWRRAALTLLQSQDARAEPPDPSQSPPSKRPIVPSSRPPELEGGATFRGAEQLPKDAHSRRTR